MNVREIQKTLAEFATDRDWDQFHSPKNLAMALAGESGELLEIFQWLTEDQSQIQHLSEKQLNAAQDEIADIMIYALRLADRLEIDIEHAIRAKIEKNALRYPVALAKGNAEKR